MNFPKIREDKTSWIAGAIGATVLFLTALSLYIEIPFSILLLNSSGLIVLAVSLILLYFGIKRIQKKIELTNLVSIMVGGAGTLTAVFIFLGAIPEALKFFAFIIQFMIGILIWIDLLD